MAPSGSVVFPMREGTYVVSDVFGSRGGTHKGVDLAAPAGTLIYAAADGTVADAGPASGFGHWVVLDSMVGDKTVSTVYGHMWAEGVLVRKGQQVRAGEPIAKVGSDGESSGPHLHLEVYPGGKFSGGQAIDPLGWFARAKTPSDTSADAATSAPTTTGQSQVSLVAAVRPSPGVGCGPGVGSAGLDVARFLADYPGAAPFVPWINKGAQACTATSAPLIAAQLRNESGFRKGMVSPAGAKGYAQFMDGTWATYGVDGDGDGTRDPNSIGDAVMSQANYNCVLMKIVKDEMAAGRLHGDPVELLLSMYNCGPGGTLAAGTVCPNAETQAYVKEIPATARKWSLPTPQPRSMLAGAFGERAVTAARRWEGTPFVWGGGNTEGPTGGRDGGGVGFDCSGLMIYAIAAASNGRIVLAHYTAQQLNDPRGKSVPADQIAPGDLVFPAGADPQHVAMYIGNGQVVHAPTFGIPVKVSPIAEAVGSTFQARRFTA
ncbi:peptidoglycan DD-metalloendopeptidase family protein [Nocardia sp. CY41]|uniref:peptidoglycan DD-metalloendopeptidase family protein n=1 Tax=Nocardia sp. CY41 TaxID=2608686 RepID=UPI001358207F|nr:peptidoglycan DD-metalloendopeptidase family protein [Nocardia sp. CY41]